MTSRRNFVKQSAFGLAGAALAMDRLLAGADEKPDTGAIVDTHVHFYDPTRPQGVPWPGKDDKLLYRRFLPEHFRALTRNCKVTGTIVVEASPWLEDNQWVLDLAKDDPFVLGLVGHLTPGTDDFRKQLERFVKNPLFRGIRIGQDQLQKGLDQERFIEDLKLLVTHDRELDVNGGPALPAAVASLAKKLPKLRLVINHAANTRIDGKEVPRDWLAGMQAAAKEGNVYCKVSALVEHTGRKNGDAPKDVEFYKPVLDALWNTFGEERLMYGSNWPVSERYATYGTVFAIANGYFQAKGKDPTEKFFWRNAAAAYKWVKRI
jgi:predicted TIM-barrel fold metal-dependent hydrolase